MNQPTNPNFAETAASAGGSDPEESESSMVAPITREARVSGIRGTEARPAGGAPAKPVPGARLRTDRGVTTISDVVVAKIAALATREIPGVHAMGKGLARAFGALRSRVPGGAPPDADTQGIAVEVGERQAAVDIDIVARYGQSIIETTEAVRANVIDRLESMTGLEVVEVNINVDDVYFDFDFDSDSDSDSNPIGGAEIPSRVL
ncbi:MAG: Asp23/Gls24 family envelope stress response protein [Acidimicrobiales bacterium]